MTIHKNVPLALQVLNDVVAGIESGELVRDNGQLPSEGELGKLFGVSRSTIREALSRLEQSGVIARQHGVGTFISSEAVVLDTGLEQLESIDTLARRIGMDTQVGDSKIVERQATPQEMDRLELPSGSEVLAVNRLILTSGNPIAYLVDIVPTTFLRACDLDIVFKGSILDVLIQRGNPFLSHALTDITVESVDSSIMRILKINGTDPILKLESLLFSREGQRLDYSFSYFIPGYFRFHVIRRVNPVNLIQRF